MSNDTVAIALERRSEILAEALTDAAECAQGVGLTMLSVAFRKAAERHVEKALRTPSPPSQGEPGKGEELYRAFKHESGACAGYTGYERNTEAEKVIEAARLVAGSYDAACFEGLADAIVESTDERLKDLLQRRVFHHIGDLNEALSALDRRDGR